MPTPAPQPDLARRSVAEFVGTAMLLMAVVGSGIAAQQLSPADAGLQLLEAALAAGFALVAIILALGPISGAHINPAVSLAAARLGHLAKRDLAPYLGAQLSGALAGVVLANLMFDLPAVEVATTAREGAALLLAEVVATFGLVLIIFAMVRTGTTSHIAFAVGLYIAGAYYFTSSTSFANPAVTVARMLTDTFTGIAPASVVPFLLAQLLGAGLAVAMTRFLTVPAPSP